MLLYFQKLPVKVVHVMCLWNNYRKFKHECEKEHEHGYGNMNLNVNVNIDMDTDTDTNIVRVETMTRFFCY
jgi:hypothetical protein